MKTRVMWHIYKTKRSTPITDSQPGDDVTSTAKGGSPRKDKFDPDDKAGFEPTTS